MLGHKVYVNGSNKCYGGGGAKNLPYMHYVIYEQPIKKAKKKVLSCWGQGEKKHPSPPPFIGTAMLSRD